MKRRKALKSLGLGLSAGLVMPQLLAACKKKDPGPEISYDGTVAVIGAGAAGLYAADILRSKGVKVIVLEASDQLGGRIKSLRNQVNSNDSIADFPVELGAEISYGSDSIWGKIIQNLKVPIVTLDATTDEFILEQTVKTADNWGSDSDFLAVQNFKTNLPLQSWPAVSVEAAAGVSSRAQPLLSSEVGNLYGSSSARVGAAGLSEGMKLLKHNNDWIVCKANPMQDLLLSRFSLVTTQVQLSTQVKSIDYSSDLITLMDQNGVAIQANKVIVTVPLSVLKSGDIAFSPALPGSMTSSLSNIGMDPSLRVVLDFKKNFWGSTASKGNFSAAAGAFPSTGGSGDAGAVVRGDKWTISEAGILGGKSVSVGYCVVALVNNPGQTATNWQIGDSDISYISTGIIWGGTNSPQIFNAGTGRSDFERTLSITINGPKAKALTDPTDPDYTGVDLITAILQELDGIYDGQATLYVRRELETDAIISTVKDWTMDEFIKGGYSYPLPSTTIDDRKNIGAPINDKLFFAGEATDIDGDAGTINGALASAERVVEEVVKSITGV